MAITGIETPGSRKIIKHASGARTIVYTYTYERGYNWESEMPADGAYTAGIGYFRGYTSTPAPGYEAVELSYDSEGVGINFAPGDGDTEYWAQTTAEEVPIEYHPDYKVRWNYGLYSKADGVARTTVDYPGGDAAYLIATNQDALLGNTKLRWFHDDPGEGWVQIKRPSKGADFYLRPARVVFMRSYHRQQSAAEAALAVVGTLATPAEIFGASTGTWLVVSSNTQYDGRYWVTETTYQNAGYTNALGTVGWDTDIYS